MGYSTAPTSMFSPDIPQTPTNVAKVLDSSGWTAFEAAYALGVSIETIADAKSGFIAMSDRVWRLLLDKAGRRSFDHDEDAA